MYVSFLSVWLVLMHLASGKDQIPHRLHAEHGTEEETTGGKP